MAVCVEYAGGRSRCAVRCGEPAVVSLHEDVQGWNGRDCFYERLAADERGMDAWRRVGKTKSSGGRQSVLRASNVSAVCCIFDQ